MKEIKFRAWDKEKKRMLFFDMKPKIDYILSEYGGIDSFGMIIESKKFHYDYLDEDDFWENKNPFMQFTGIKDNTKWEQLKPEEQKAWVESGKTKEQWKGKEIYEGDIIRCGDYIEDANAYNEWQSEVVWNNEQGMWQGIDGERNEIIGNIYESNIEELK